MVEHLGSDTPAASAEPDSADLGWWQAPTLAGRRVVLERLDHRHALGLLLAADSDAIFTHLRFPRPQTLSDADQLVSQAEADLLAGTAVTWAQVVDGQVAGVTSYYDLSPRGLSLAIGSTWLGTRWQRSGINREAKLLLLERAFDTLGCVRVVWHTDERNRASREAIAALGVTSEGLLRKHKRRRDGTWRTTAQFSMTDDDWPAARRSLQSKTDRPRTVPEPGRH
ncbi:MAG: GNAT family N-acetyltransferase [Janthinobacterium lividum]